MKFTDRIRDDAHRLGWNSIERGCSDCGLSAIIADEAADIINELEAALLWFIENDDTNEGDEPMAEYGGLCWNEINEYWIDGLKRGRNALEKLNRE